MRALTFDNPSEISERAFSYASRTKEPTVFRFEKDILSPSKLK